MGASAIESIPRQADKKFGGERGLGFLKQRKGSGNLKEEEKTNIFFSLYIP